MKTDMKRILLYAAVIDFTARDLQRKASEAGQPWTICKGFDGSAAIGEWVPKEKFLDIQRLHFHLDINGQTVQVMLLM